MGLLRADMGSTPHSEAVTIAGENKAVPSESQGQYNAMGLLVVDYSTGHSFNKDDHDGGASTRAFEAMGDASRCGGIGTIRSPDSELIAVGRYGTDGIRLLESVGTKDYDLKGLQFKEYTVLGPGDDRYERAKEISGTLGSAVRNLPDDKAADLQELLAELAAKGRMRRPVR